MKKFLTLALAVGMTAALSIPALAASVAVGDVETGRDSTGHAVIRNDEEDATIHNVVGDDRPHDSILGRDFVQGADGAQIDVQAKIVGNEPAIIPIIGIEWGDMRFVFSRASQTWDPLTHTYSGTAGQWLEDNSSIAGGTATEFYLVGDSSDSPEVIDNNQIIVTNHSNAAMDAQLSYTVPAAVSNRFNANSNLASSVKGGFYGSSDEAKAGALLLDNPRLPSSGYNTLGTFLAAEISEKQPLYTAVKRDPTPEPDPVTGLFEQGNILNAYFAFSGTPDAAAALTSDPSNPFTKVGVITVTITPNNDPEYNTPGDWDGPVTP